MSNNYTIPHLLRSIASGTQAQENKHDIIFVATADAYEAMLDALLSAESAMAAHNISRKHERHGCPWDFAEGFGGTLDDVRAAIAKATGAAS